MGREYNFHPRGGKWHTGPRNAWLYVGSWNNYARKINAHNAQISKFVFYKIFSRDF